MDKPEISEKHSPTVDKSIDSIFLGIGKAKEDTAQGLMEEQKKEKLEAQKRRNFLATSQGEVFDEDVDLDELEKTIDARIAAIKNPEKSKISTSPILPESEKILNEEITPEFEFDFNEKDTNAEKEFKDDLAVDDTEIVEIISEPQELGNRIYISTMHNERTEQSGYACVVIAETGQRLIEARLIDDTSGQDAPFRAAIYALNAVERLKLTNTVLYMDKNISKLLRRNAFGMVDGYNEYCEKYISRVKEISEKAYVEFAIEESVSTFAILAKKITKTLIETE